MNPQELLEQALGEAVIDRSKIVKDIGLSVPPFESTGERYIDNLVGETFARYRKAALENDAAQPLLDDVEYEVEAVLHTCLPQNAEAIWQTFADIKGWRYPSHAVDSDEPSIMAMQFLYLIGQDIVWEVWRTLYHEHSDIMLRGFRKGDAMEKQHKNQCECGAFWCLTDHTYENNLRAFDPES